MRTNEKPEFGQRTRLLLVLPFDPSDVLLGPRGSSSFSGDGNLAFGNPLQALAVTQHRRVLDQSAQDAVRFSSHSLRQLSQAALPQSLDVVTGLDAMEAGMLRIFLGRC